MMRSSILLTALLALTGTANAGSKGPFSYYSNGYTTTNPPSNYCPTGSNCVLRSGPTLLSDQQIVEFRFTTGSSFPGNVNDHFAFGVRGNSTPASCQTGERNFPFLGRGVALYPNEKLFFENFSTSCYGTNSVTPVQNLLSTEIPLTLSTSTTYWVSVWADNYDTGIELWQEYYVGGARRYAYVASANCRSLASAYESGSCGRHPNDQFYGNRTFIAYTTTSQWSIQDWWLHD